MTRVALVTPTQASTVLTASGYIVARSKAEISPKSVGRVDWLNLEEGQRVRKGELVARLESQELEAQRKQYAASREQALAELVNARLERQRLGDPPEGPRREPAGLRRRRRAREGSGGPGRLRRGAGALRRRADQELRDLRADRRRRDREEGLRGRDGCPAGLRRGRLGGGHVRRHRRPRLARDGGRHQRAEPRAPRHRPAGGGRARRLPRQAVQGPPSPDRPDGRPAEGIGEGQDRGPRPGRAKSSRRCRAASSS